MVIAALVSGFAIAFVGAMPPTGPVAVLVLQRSVDRAYRQAFALAVGAAIAEGAYTALAVFGLGAIFDRVPWAEVVARLLGVAVLFALGLRFLRFSAVAPGAEADRGSGRREARRAFATGFGVSAANPILLMTWGTALAMLYAFAGLRFDAAAGVAFSLAVPLGIVCWLAILIALVRRFSDRLTVRVATSIVRAAGGVMLVTSIVLGGSMLARVSS